MISDIKASFFELLEANDWMDSTTKATARLKVSFDTLRVVIVHVLSLIRVQSSS